MPPLTLSNDMPENQFTIDKELYDSTLSIRDELNMVAERVSKMDEHKAEVSEAVYLRVKSDYLIKYDQIKKTFEAKTQEIKSALQMLYKGKGEQEAELKKHTEILEEAKFRNFLGEYTDKKFKEIESRETAEIKKFEQLLSLIETNIKQYEELIGGPLKEVSSANVSVEPTLETKRKIPLVDESVSVAITKMDEIPDNVSKLDFGAFASTEEAYTLDTEGDYFKNDSENLSEAEPSIVEHSDETKSLPVENLPKLKTKAKPIPEQNIEMEEAPTSKQRIKLKTEKPKTGLGFDDSISSILKSIPLDEPEEEQIPDEAMLPSEDIPQVPESEMEEDDIVSDEVSEVISGKTRLVCIEGSLTSTEFELEENTSIGRSPSNDIVLKEPKVSRQHAAINLIDGNYVIVDLKSSNGVIVNGSKVEEYVLEDGDEVVIGNSKMIYHAGI